jgi:hypothetical protein
MRFDQKFELESVTRLSFSGLSHSVALGLSFDVASRVIEAATAKHGQACHQVAVIQGQNSGRRRLATGRHRGQLMKRLKIAQLFGAPKSARKTKARLAGAKLLIVAARERAAMTAQRYAASPLMMRPMRPPTALQRRRLAERLDAKF